MFSADGLLDCVVVIVKAANCQFCKKTVSNVFYFFAEYNVSYHALGRDIHLTLEASKKNLLHETLRGGGTIRTPPPPSTFDTIHPIDLHFDTYNKLHLYFQLSETTWYRIGFYGNNSQINDVTGVAILDFQIFRFGSNFHFCTTN